MTAFPPSSVNKPLSCGTSVFQHTLCAPELSPSPNFVAEVAELDDPNPEEDDRCKFPGFHRPARTGMRIKDRSEDEEGKEEDEEDEEDEDSPLYMMDALMSEADVLMSSEFKPSHYSKQSKEDVEEDIEQTPIAKGVKKRK